MPGKIVRCRESRFRVASVVRRARSGGLPFLEFLGGWLLTAPTTMYTYGRDIRLTPPTPRCSVLGLWSFMADIFPKTVTDLDKLFPDEEACRGYLEWLRWPEGFVCPKCQVKDGWQAT